MNNSVLDDFQNPEAVIRSGTSGGSLGRITMLCQTGIDPVFHNIARPKNEHSSRRNWHFFTRLGIATNTLAFLPNTK